MEIGYSELTGKVYIGRSKVERSGVRRWVGEKRDITSEFIGVMLQKFGPDTGSNGAETTITKADGTPEFVVRVVRATNEGRA